MTQKKKTQKGRLSAVRSNELLCCPFCGGKSSDHPAEEYQDDYFVCYHMENCFLNDAKQSFNFTLIPRNYMVDRWQHRVVPRFGAT